MTDLTKTIGTAGEIQLNVEDTAFKVELAEYGGYGPAGPQGNDGPAGPPGPPGSSTATATDINVSVGGITTDLQTAITQLSQLFFQQASAPVVGVSQGDLWFDTTSNVLKVYQDAVWVTVLAQPNLDVAIIDSGWF